MLKHFGVPISDFVLVSDATFAVVLHEFGDACLVEERGGKIVLTCINFWRHSYAVLKIRLDEPVIWSRLKICPAMWKVCLPLGSVSFSVFHFQCLGFVHASSDSCHLQKFWLCWEAPELMRPAFLWNSWDLQTPGTGYSWIHSRGRQTPLFLQWLRKTLQNLIFQLHDFLKTVVTAFLDEYSAECTCVFSFQKYFLHSCFWMSACPSSPNIHVVRQWAHITE